MVINIIINSIILVLILFYYCYIPYQWLVGRLVGVDMTPLHAHIHRWCGMFGSMLIVGALAQCYVA